MQAKNVVTANKDLVAEHGKELFEAAERNQKDIFIRGGCRRWYSNHPSAETVSCGK